MSHSSDKVSVCSGNASLILSKNTHISAKTRSAGRSTYDSAGFNEGTNQTLFYCIKIYLLCTRNYDKPHTFGNMSALKQSRRSSKVIHTSVSTRTDNNLINLNLFLYIGDGPGILRKMRECYCRLK